MERRQGEIKRGKGNDGGEIRETEGSEEKSERDRERRG